MSMFSPPKTKKAVLRMYPRAVHHLRTQKERKSLGLVFGAGVNDPLGIPNWRELVEAVAKNKRVRGKAILKKAEKNGQHLSAITQILFNRFQEACKSIKKLNHSVDLCKDRKINTEWLRLIHNILYGSYSDSEIMGKIRGHPYLSHYVELIKSMPMTVTYNFDEVLQLLILSKRDPEEKERERGYETVVGEGAQIKKREGVIYHPNGFIAFHFENGTSQGITFSDESFADQLIENVAGRYASLNHFISNTTCLFIGLSLSDGTLRHQLRQSARLNPGQYHYLVWYVDDDKQLDEDLKVSIFESYFKVFNLITLFLGNAGLRSLASLIKMDSGSFEQLCETTGVVTKYCYYLVGPVGVGKSTAISFFKGLTTYDEWMDIRPKLMNVPDAQLTPTERKKVDRWVARQFYKKNSALARKTEGIHIIDRTPLDPLTFGSSKHRRNKARNLLKTICPTTDRRVESGQVIFLRGRIDEIHARLLCKHKEWPDEKIQDNQNQISEIYGFPEVAIIDTTIRSIEEVVKETAKIIFCHDYKPMDIHKGLQFWADGGTKEK